MTLATLGAPAVHVVRGHGGRSLASLGMRAGLTSLGVVVAMVANQGCERNTDALLGDLCTLDYVGYGYLAGFVVAVVTDAALLTDEPREAPRWSPQIAAGREGARVGVALAW